MEKKENRLELVFILDRSGSMSGLESDTIGGCNSVLEKQRKGQGAVRVTTVLFDDQYELLHDRFDIERIKPLTEDDYYVRGCTALLDAIGRTITKISKVPEPDKVMFVIITDGLENASREYCSNGVKKMVKKHRKQGWEFLFLGANIDAVETAADYGISADRAANYHADSRGTQLNFTAVCEAVKEVRCSRKLSPGWKKAIDADYEQRNPER